MMLLYIMVTSTLMAVSSTNLLMTWVSLEINLFCFVPVLLNYKKDNEIEASFIYFLSQALGSVLFLLGSFMSLTLMWFSLYSMTIILMAISLKLGAVPCHYWYPATMSKTTWLNCFLLSSWQKFAPLFIMLYIILPTMTNAFTTIIVILNAMIGGMMGLSQTSMKKIMAYSSITHMGWMLSGSITNTPCLSITYLFLYSVIILPLFSLLNKEKLNMTYDMWVKKSLHPSKKILMSLLLLSLGGLPPFTGFIPKLIMMMMLLNHSSTVITALITGSIMNLYFYLNIIINALMGMNQQNNPLPYTMKLKTINTMLALSFFTLFIMLM